MTMDLFRLKSVFAWTVVLSGAVTLAACSSDNPDSGPTDNGVPGNTDGGVVENMDAETGMDAPTGDRGRMDAMPTDRGDVGVPDPCPDNTEGCECTNTATAAVVPFLKDSCNDGLLCVNWDLISGLRVGGANPQLDGPVKSCVKPCMVDNDCGAGRHCASIGFTEETMASKICVDKVAGNDEYCSGSRLAVEQVTDPNTMDGTDQITACEEGLTCQLFTFGDNFNPDEGVCMNFCDTDADCTFATLPYCNPRLFTTTSSTGEMGFAGSCTDGRHPNGAICGSSDPDKTFIYGSYCDTSEATCGTNSDACPVCIGINLDANNSLTPSGQGICMSPCNNMTPCVGQRTCVPNFFNNGDGVCSDSCTALPETCPGEGSLMNGQDCLELQGGAAFCVDRYTPVLVPALFDGTGNFRSMGDDCTGDLQNYSFFRCPDGATCLPQMNAPGLCVQGCTPNDMNFGADYCKTLLNSATATCAPQAQAMFGVCGDG
jgi:hypothetical protein